MDMQENKTENSENKEVDFKVDFRKIISNNRILVIAITGFIIVITLLYFIADEKSHNNFGDYFGGVLNPILAFISFIAILWTVALQRHSINLQSEELRLTREELKETKNELAGSRKAQEEHTKLFEQQQFETTFFKLLDKIEQYKNYKDLMQFYLSLNVIYRQLSNYKNNYKKEYEQNFIFNKYNNVVKSYFSQDILLKILDDENIYRNLNSIEIYSDIKNIIEQYGLFEYFKVDIQIDGYFEDDYSLFNFSNINQKEFNYIYRYNISAFINNIYIIPLIIGTKEISEEYIVNIINNNDPFFTLLVMFCDYEYIIFNHIEIITEKMCEIKITTNIYSDILWKEIHIIRCMTKFLYDDRYHKNDVSVIISILEKIIEYFSWKMVFFVHHINKATATELIDKIEKIFCLYFMFLNKVFSYENISENDMIEIINYLLNKTTNTRDRIIIIFLLQKIFSLKDCHCSNWQQIKETIGNMYREIVTFRDVPKTDDMTITYLELTEPKNILIDLALSGNYMKFNNKIYQEFIKNPYQLTQLE